MIFLKERAHNSKQYAKNLSKINNLKVMENLYMINVLHQAVDRGDLQRLKKIDLFSEREINSKDEQGLSVLHKAVQNGNLEMVKFLISIGACIEDEDRIEEMTPLHFAAIEGHIEIMKILLKKGANVEAKNKFGETPLHLADSPDVIKCLLENNSSFGGIPIDSKDKDGFTPLHVATKNGNIVIAKCLVDYGADLDAKDENGLTPLHYSTIYGHLEIVKYLIKFGANIEARDMEGCTPLHDAIRYGTSLDVAKYLIEKNANINSKDNRTNTPLGLAARLNKLDMVELLVAGNTTSSSKCQLDSKNITGSTALHAAAKHGYLDVLKYLVEHGAKIDIRNNKGKTAFELSKEKGHTEIAKDLLVKKREAGNENPAENLNDKARCIICLSPRNGLYSLIPCGHTSLCELCCFNLTIEKKNSSKCPSCRKPIQKYMKIFFQEPESD